MLSQHTSSTSENEMSAGEILAGQAFSMQSARVIEITALRKRCEPPSVVRHAECRL